MTQFGQAISCNFTVLSYAWKNGKIVKSIGSNGIAIDGNQLSWDGRDSNGRYVSTGVYLLLIYNDNGSSSEHKITVIKSR